MSVATPDADHRLVAAAEHCGGAEAIGHEVLLVVGRNARKNLNVLEGTDPDGLHPRRCRRPNGR